MKIGCYKRDIAAAGYQTADQRPNSMM